MLRNIIAGTALVACLSATPVQGTVTVATVPIANPGNANDTEGTGFGAVAYPYEMGKFEITAGQYTEFLNAVAKADTFGLWVGAMETNLQGSGITRTGSTPNFFYSVAPYRANRPANYIKMGSAMRFANWMHNNQPIGPQGLNTTEDGSYFLNGAVNPGPVNSVVRKATATWVVPSDNEWYKAAYYDGAANVYYNFPTGTDVLPSLQLIDPDPGNNATYTDGVGNFTIGAPLWRTEVGAHENSKSPYGTYDQGGNVPEWTEGLVAGSPNNRRVWGGAHSMLASAMLASNPSSGQAGTALNPDRGFRLAFVPEPSSFALLVTGCLADRGVAALWWREFKSFLGEPKCEAS